MKVRSLGVPSTRRFRLIANYLRVLVGLMGAAAFRAPYRRVNTARRPPEPVRIDRRLLEILVCPLTKNTLEYDSARQELVSRSARLAYPIRDGIPIMLPDEARVLDL